MVSFLSQRRELLDDAYAGDIIGIPNHGVLQLGDTLTEGEELQFTGLPFFAPEMFRSVEIADPLRSKQLKTGLAQLGEEGAIQVFRPVGGPVLLLGAVGQLQFEVVAHRLEHEYGVQGAHDAVALPDRALGDGDDDEGAAALHRRQRAPRGATTRSTRRRCWSSTRPSCARSRTTGRRSGSTRCASMRGWWCTRHRTPERCSRAAARFPRSTRGPDDSSEGPGTVGHPHGRLIELQAMRCARAKCDKPHDPSRFTGRSGSGPHFGGAGLQMPDRYRRSIAIGLAQAMLAGPCEAAGLAARLRAASGESAPWIATLAAAVAQACAMSWPRLRAENLAERLLHEPAFHAAFDRPDPLRIRRYILRPPIQRPPPLGLDAARLPHLPAFGDLAAWLGLDAAALESFTALPARRRKGRLEDQPYRWRWWPKPHGGIRLLEVPRPRLKALQRRLLDGLLSQVPPHEAACGFVPGRGVIDHARVHSGQAVVLGFDLRDFFGSVRASRVHALFATLGYAHEVSRALTALVTSRVPEPGCNACATTA